MQKIVTSLWFEDQAEDAAKFYTSVFKNSKITQIERFTDEAAQATGEPAGAVMMVEFELNGQRFMALNGSPQIKFTEATSLLVNCDSQAEVDDLWAKLTADGGQESQCGWLKDKYGLSWQIVPTEVMTMLRDKDVKRSARMFAAVMTMRKLDLAALRQVYEGK